MTEPELPVVYAGLQGLSWLSKAELAKVIEHLPHGGDFLEVGTAAGVTAAKIADERPGLRITCVDTFNVNADPTMADSDPDRLAKWVANRRPSMCLWYGPFAAFHAVTRPYVFDAVLVDADHTHHAAFADLSMAEDLLQKDGMILVHDFQTSDWPGVTWAVEKFCRETPFKIVDHAGSLVVLRRVVE